MSKETMIRISLWGILLAAFGIFGTLLFIVHNEAVAAGKATTELERTVMDQYVKEVELDKRLDRIDKNIQFLIELHTKR